MRHRKKRNKLTRSKDQRRILLRSLATSLILKEKITTTESKAKKMRPYVEKCISRAKKNTLANKRILLKDFSEKTLEKLIKLGERYKDRPGGYSRIIKINPRKTDSAKMAIIELINGKEN